ncbi:uncharacterized protein N0V89_003849 [Didymosphaeria variabile]|uniref:Xylanolytic transcriptional activator regulatory domain-containing protein n=1 Tax=Didymosphaeria variabile TaxID=1932322 RepID=A0A9W8XND9_9PLEO|nr:uncharacterized protein N0V89_003849 [Didymosphaeria variabile]KAJ4355828.1 hypothetical protein N0V89_003849 [Didymosphaeria variabile]
MVTYGEATQPVTFLPASHKYVDRTRVSPVWKYLVDDTSREFGDDGNDEEEEEYEEDDDAIVSWCLQNQPYNWRGNATGPGQGILMVTPNGKSHYVARDTAKHVPYFERVLSSTQVETPPGLITRSATTINRCEHLDANSLLKPQRAKGSLLSSYPSMNIIPKLWDHYTEHVDTMFKVVFKPDVARLILHICRGFHIDPSSEALLFAIWFAVIASTSAEDCQALHGIERNQLLRKYRIALEQALVQADWIATQEIVILQSLAIYLAFASEKTRSTWVLSGIVISLAQAIGLHMSIASSPLTPVEIEVRRRIWWSLCQIDVRVSNNCGLEPHVPLVVDCELPLHVNDADLDAGHNADDTSPRKEKTEMTLSLIKIEHAYTTLRFKRAQYRSSHSDGEKKDHLIGKQIQRYTDVYMKYFEDPSEFSRLCALGLQLIIARLRKLIPDASDSQGHVDTEALNEPLLLYNADVLNIAQQLPEMQRQYGWFFRCKCSQWHALVYLLIHLCKYTQGAAVDRAWAAVDAFFITLGEKYHLAAPRFFDGTFTGKKDALWQPLLRLLAKARDSRAQSLQTTKEVTISSERPIDERPADHPAKQKGMLADPFLGQSFDFEEEMNWEQIDVWAHDFQAVLAREDGLGHAGEDVRDALDWW